MATAAPPGEGGLSYSQFRTSGPLDSEQSPKLSTADNT